MQNYKFIKRLDQGTFSYVIKAQNLKNAKYVAIKCMKNTFKSYEQVNNLREIQALRRLSPHPHIITLHEVLFDPSTGRLALVFELMERNLYDCIKNEQNPLDETIVKKWFYQVLLALEHMHRNGIFHRDIKPENILVKGNTIKLADFGSCRGIYSRKPFTEYISTRWYRPPECLLTDGWYGQMMDIWGLGCVIFEVVALYPLFPGANELDQVKKIHAIIGTPTKDVLDKYQHKVQNIDFNFKFQSGTGIRCLLPLASEHCIDLVEKMLKYDPDDRLTALLCLQHPWFAEIRDPPPEVFENKSVINHHLPQTSVSLFADSNLCENISINKFDSQIEYQSSVLSNKNGPTNQPFPKVQQKIYKGIVSTKDPKKNPVGSLSLPPIEVKPSIFNSKQPDLFKKPYYIKAKAPELTKQKANHVSSYVSPYSQKFISQQKQLKV